MGYQVQTGINKQVISKAYSLYRVDTLLKGSYKPQNDVLGGKGSRDIAKGLKTPYKASTG